MHFEWTIPLSYADASRAPVSTWEIKHFRSAFPLSSLTLILVKAFYFLTFFFRPKHNLFLTHCIDITFCFCSFPTGQNEYDDYGDTTPTSDYDYNATFEYTFFSMLKPLLLYILTDVFIPVGDNIITTKKNVICFFVFVFNSLKYSKYWKVTSQIKSIVH